MKKKILMNLSFSVWPMLGYELDFIQQKLNEGHIIKILYCNGSPTFCSANNSKILNYKKLKLVCGYCKSKFNNGLEWLSNKENLIVENFNLITSNQNKKLIEYKKLIKNKKTVDDKTLNFLKQINKEIENICRTTLITETNETFTNYKSKKNFNLFKKISIACLESYFSSLNHLEKFKPDEIYIYNGRIYRYQPMLLLSKSKIKNENIFTYEFPVNGYENFMISKKNYFHDLKNLSHQYLEFNEKNKINFSKKKLIAEKWINDKVIGDEYKNSYFPWKNNIKKNKISQDFDDTKFNITYFTSTETEFIGIPENEKEFGFAGNLEIIENIIKIIENSEAILNVKMHPQVNRDSKILLKQLIDLQEKFSNLKIIEPKSDIDNYYLIKKTDLVIVMNSTVGIESAYLKKNVICLANSSYMGFGAVKNVNNFQDLKTILNRCIYDKNFSDFPSDENKTIGSINFIYALINFNFKSKFLIKKNYKHSIMFKNNKMYKLDGNLSNKLVFIIYSILRFFMKKLNIYI